MLGDKTYVIEYELVSPIAVGRDRILPNLKSGFSADRIVSRVNTEGLPFRKAAEVRENLTKCLDHEPEHIKEVCRHDRKLELLSSCFGKARHRLGTLIDVLE